LPIGRITKTMQNLTSAIFGESVKSEKLGLSNGEKRIIGGNKLNFSKNLKENFNFSEIDQKNARLLLNGLKKFVSKTAFCQSLYSSDYKDIKPSFINLLKNGLELEKNEIIGNDGNKFSMLDLVLEMYLKPTKKS